MPAEKIVVIGGRVQPKNHFILLLLTVTLTASFAGCGRNDTRELPKQAEDSLRGHYFLGEAVSLFRDHSSREAVAAYFRKSKDWTLSMERKSPVEGLAPLDDGWLATSFDRFTGVSLGYTTNDQLAVLQITVSPKNEAAALKLKANAFDSITASPSAPETAAELYWLGQVRLDEQSRLKVMLRESTMPSGAHVFSVTYARSYD